MKRYLVNFWFWVRRPRMWRWFTHPVITAQNWWYWVIFPHWEGEEYDPTPADCPYGDPVRFIR